MVPQAFTGVVAVLGLASVGVCSTYNRIGDVPNINWDFIIAGGGTAGSVLASRLTENPRFNVLVIEAGPTRLANSIFDWNFTTVPQAGLNGRSVSIQRGHILGGTSAVNGMVYTRGPSSDFDRYAAVTGDPGWSWKNIQKYIKKHEKFEPPVDNHNITGQFDPRVHSFDGKVPVTLPGFLYPEVDSAVVKAGQELGGEFQFNLDMNSGTPLGLGWLQSTIGHDGTRSSASASYLDAETKSRKNLHILTDTRVTRVLKTKGTKDLALRTVEILSAEGSQPVLMTASKEVIIAGGSIGTPHILLHSGIGDENDLKALNIPTVLHNPSVGRNLSDHPIIVGLFNIAPNSIDVGPWGNLAFDPALQEQALQLWNTNRTGPLVTLIPAGSHLAWTRLPDDSPILKSGDPSSGKISGHIELILEITSPILVAGVALVSPTSRGSVSIGSNNPFDNPLIDPQFLTSEFDLPAIREGLKQAIRFTKATPWNGVIAGSSVPPSNATTDAELEEAIRNSGASGLHPVGTASMSPKNANWGVVDPDLLVKKASGLRIVDASIMPYVPCAHTQTPVYIIAERAADMIKAAWH